MTKLGATGVGLGLSLALLTRPAAAQENDSLGWDGGFGQKAERRSDFVIGLATGVLLGSARGYPNEVDKIDVPEFESNTGFQLGVSGMAWIGGAFTDWFTYGLGYAHLTGEGSDGKGTGNAFLFHIEAFPLYSLGGPLRDLALFGNFGAGGYSVDGPRDEEDDGDGGFASFVGLGSAYELFRFGHFALGPNVEYLNLRSATLSAHQFTVGARIVFYGGPS